MQPVIKKTYESWIKPAHPRLDQAMNGEAFKEYLRSQLGQTLKPGDIFHL